jgi:hypothetical protein
MLGDVQDVYLGDIRDVHRQMKSAHPAGAGGAGVDAVSVWRSVALMLFSSAVVDRWCSGLLVGDGVVLGAGGG